MRNSSENKMVGTVSNKIKSMSNKEKMKQRRIRLQNMTESEKAIMKKYGRDWNTAYRETLQ
tara:strand:- start:3 stop:185 length:183 start_codon:yes stop_codon:yes gene_type:complete